MSIILRDLGLLFYIVPVEPESGAFSSAEDVPDYISRAVPYFLLLIVLECLYGWIRSYKFYSLKDTVMSISLGIVQQLAGIWMKELQILPYLFVYDLFAPLRAHILQSPYWPELTAHQYSILTFVVGFLGCDVGYYFLHRTAHEWQLLWSAHSVHHSGERYNFATALRQGTFQSTYSWFFYVWLAALGLPVTHFIRHNRLNTVYQFWIHTEIVGRCPWVIELFMNTPSHHRLHHRPPGNCNYAGVLIIWDRLFCTFHSERHLPQTKLITSTEAVPTGRTRSNSHNNGKPSIINEEKVSFTTRGVIYGLAKPLDNFDPVYANMSHLLRITSPKTATDGTSEGDSAWFFSRAWKVLLVVVTKRIKQNLRITFSPQELMPDIFADWEIQRRQVRSYSPFAYLHHLWSELWELPPPVDESGLSDKIVLATNVPGIGTRRAEYSHRDKVFLLGRQARERPVLSKRLMAAVSVQFLLSLVVSNSVMMLAGKEDSINAAAASAGIGASSVQNATLGQHGAAVGLFGGPEGERLVRFAMALICIACAISLQSIKLYYK